MVLRPRAALGHRPGKAVLRRARHRGRHSRGVGHRFHMAQVLAGVGEGESVRLAAIGGVIERYMIGTGFIARVPRRPFVSPLRVQNAQPARAAGAFCPRTP